MKTEKIIAVLPFLLIFLSPLRADLIWDAEKGWYADGGLAELFFPTEGDAVNAIEAMNQAKEAQVAGKSKKAESLYNFVYRNYKQSIFAPEALLQKSKIKVEQKRLEKAFVILQRIVKEYPSYDKFDDVIQEQYNIALAFKNGARSRLFWGMVPGFKSDQTAMDYFEEVLQNARFGANAAPSLMHIAEIANRNNSHQEAIFALDRLINNYPQYVEHNQAYLKLARTYKDVVQGSSYDLDTTKAAASYYEDYLTLFPETEEVKEAETGLQETQNTLSKSKYEMAEYYYRVKRNDAAAKILYNEAITIAPDSQYAIKAQERLDQIEQGIKRAKAPGSRILGSYGLPKVPEKAKEPSE